MCVFCCCFAEVRIRLIAAYTVLLPSDSSLVSVLLMGKSQVGKDEIMFIKIKVRVVIFLFVLVYDTEL